MTRTTSVLAARLIAGPLGCSITGSGSDSNDASVKTDSVYVFGDWTSPGNDFDVCIKNFDSDGEEQIGSMAVGGNGDLCVLGLFDNGVGAYEWVIKKFAPDGTEDTLSWDKHIDAKTGSVGGLSVVVTY